MEEELPSIHVVEHKVEFTAGLEGEMKADQKWMTHVVQENVSLRHDMLDFVSFDDGFLLQDLDGITLLCGLLFAQVDLENGAWNRNVKSTEGGRGRESKEKSKKNLYQTFKNLMLKKIEVVRLVLKMQ